MAFDRPCEQTQGYSLVETSSGYRSAEPGETPDASVVTGPGAIGGFLAFVPEPARLKPGPALAPRVARAFEWADRELGTEIGGAAPASTPGRSTC